MQWQCKTWAISPNVQTLVKLRLYWNTSGTNAKINIPIQFLTWLNINNCILHNQIGIHFQTKPNYFSQQRKLCLSLCSNFSLCLPDGGFLTENVNNIWFYNQSTRFTSLSIASYLCSLHEVPKQSFIF